MLTDKINVTSDDVITGQAPARYAQALIDLASDAKSLNSVEKDLKSVAEAFEESGDLQFVAASPVFAKDDKVRAFDAIGKTLKLSALTQQFIGTIVSNRRTEEIPAIIAAFNYRLALQRGTQVAKVTSAAPLTTAQITQLKTKLKSVTGNDVTVETDVDPDLLGGFRVKLASRLYDASLKTKLEDLRLALKS